VFCPSTSRRRARLLTRGTTEAPSSSGNPSSRTTGATPAEVPEEQQFSLEDAAEFDDGLLIEIAGAVADKAAKTDRGAEMTNGEIVITSVRIENKTKESYAAENVLICAKYGTGKDAQIIIDKTMSCRAGSSARSRQAMKRSPRSASLSHSRS
jgi:hypothetical protein